MIGARCKFTNNHTVGSDAKEEKLNAGVHFEGANFKGKIVGDENDPAVISNATVESETELTNVILDDNVELPENVTLINVRVTVDENTTLPVLTSENRTNGRGIDKNNKPSTAFFAGGFSVEGGSFKQNAKQQSSQQTEIKGQIRPDAQHIGKKANLLVVGIYYSPGSDNVEAYYTADEQGIPHKLEVGKDGWPVLDKQVHKRDVILEENMNLDVYEGLLPIGRIDIYFGYQIVDETGVPIVIYMPSSMRADVTD